MKLTPQQTQRLSGAVAAAEARTSVELVLSLVPRSRAYFGVPSGLGALAAFVTLCLALFLEEPEVEPGLVIPLVGLVGLLAFVLGSFLPVAWRSRAADRSRAVETAAHAAFSRQGVHRTTSRTGCLVFVSLEEGEARLIADQGVLAALPADVREDFQARLTQVAAHFDLESLAKELEALGARAGGFLPRAEDDVDELPNAPVVGAA